MTRFFNTAGPCDPDLHYMLPPERRIPGVRSLLEQRAYFVVHAPRQTGKTTSFRKLASELVAEGRYAAVHLSGEQRFAIELKVWRDGRPDPRVKGREQLASYLERLSLDSGTLIVFDQRREAKELPTRISRSTEKLGDKVLEIVCL